MISPVRLGAVLSVASQQLRTEVWRQMAAVGNGWDLISAVVWLWSERLPQGFMLRNVISLRRCEKAGNNPTLEFSNEPLSGGVTEIKLCFSKGKPQDWILTAIQGGKLAGQACNPST